MFPRQTANQNPLSVPKSVKYAALSFGLMAAILVICLAATAETRAAAAVAESQKPLPDLVVERGSSRANTPDKPVIAMVTVRNQGSAPARSVNLEVNFDERVEAVTTPPKGTDGRSCTTPELSSARNSTRRSFSTTCKAEAEIQPGESVTFSFELVRKANSDQNAKLAIVALVDGRHWVKESNEKNNQILWLIG